MFFVFLCECVCRCGYCNVGLCVYLSFLMGLIFNVVVRIFLFCNGLLCLSCVLCNVCAWLCLDFEICCCAYVCCLEIVRLCVCWYFNMWGCVCVGFLCVCVFVCVVFVVYEFCIFLWIVYFMNVVGFVMCGCFYILGFEICGCLHGLVLWSVVVYILWFL